MDPMGLAAAGGAGSIGPTLQQLLQQRIMQEQMSLQIAKAIADQQMDTSRLGLARDQLTQQGQQFDASLGQRKTEHGFDVRKYDEGAPARAAETEGLQLRNKGVLRGMNARDALRGDPTYGQAVTAREADIPVAAIDTLDPKGEQAQGQALERIRVGAQESRKTVGMQAAMGGQGKPDYITLISPQGLTQMVPKGGEANRLLASGWKQQEQRRAGPIGQERAALSFYNRAKQAMDTVDAVESKVTGGGLLNQLQLQMAPNILQTGDQQAYRQAQRAFTEARLRKESGAAIPDAEYENDAKTYFAQPGDGPEMIAQKRAARQAVLDGIGFAAGAAYEEFYGEPFQKNAAGVQAMPQGGGGLPPGVTVTRRK